MVGVERIAAGFRGRRACFEENVNSSICGRTLGVVEIVSVVSRETMMIRDVRSTWSVEEYVYID